MMYDKKKCDCSLSEVTIDGQKMIDQLWCEEHSAPNLQKCWCGKQACEHNVGFGNGTTPPTLQKDWEIEFEETIYTGHGKLPSKCEYPCGYRAVCAHKIKNFIRTLLASEREAGFKEGANKAEEEKKELYEALQMMWDQYCPEPFTHKFMGAGENCEIVLEKYHYLVARNLTPEK